tara:strand:- start:1083 stop:1253 length:171 start_codon:yes stop_codon:yes gene_type:complete
MLRCTPTAVVDALGWGYVDPRETHVATGRWHLYNSLTHVVFPLNVCLEILAHRKIQ